MDEPRPCTAGGPGLGFGEICVNVDPVFNTGVWSLPFVYGFFLTLLGGARWRAAIRGWLYAGAWSACYAGLLQDLLGRLDRVFGRPLGWKAFERCFALAMLYGLVFLLFVGAGEIENTQGLGAWASPVFLLLTLTLIAPAAWLYRGVRRRAEAARADGSAGRRAATRGLEIGGYILATAAVLVATILTTALPLFVWSGTGDPVAASAFAAWALALAVAVFAAAAIAGTAAFATVAAAAILGPLVFASSIAPPQIIGFLAVIAVGVPLINAAFDWLSWAASRWLMARLARDAARPGRARWTAMALHVLADIAAACLLLFALAIAIAAFVRAAASPEIWGAYAAAQVRPFEGTGAAMTVMLASTLVPTAIHLGFAIFALAVLRLPFAGRVAFLMQDGALGGRGEEKGTHVVAALYLTVCAGFAMGVLWLAGRALLIALDQLTGDLPGAFWRSIFVAADAVARSL